WDPLIVPTVNASPCDTSGRIVDDRDQGRGHLASHGPFLPRPHRPTLELMPDLVQEGLAPPPGEDHRVPPPKGKQTPPRPPAAHSQAPAKLVGRVPPQELGDRLPGQPFGHGSMIRNSGRDLDPHTPTEVGHPAFLILVHDPLYVELDLPPEAQGPAYPRFEPLP